MNDFCQADTNVGAEGADKRPSGLHAMSASTKQTSFAISLQSLSKSNSWVAKPENILASLEKEGILSAAEIKIVLAILQQDKLAGPFAQLNE